MKLRDLLELLQPYGRRQHDLDEEVGIELPGGYYYGGVCDIKRVEHNDTTSHHIIIVIET